MLAVLQCFTEFLVKYLIPFLLYLIISLEPNKSFWLIKLVWSHIRCNQSNLPSTKPKAFLLGPNCGAQLLGRIISQEAPLSLIGTHFRWPAPQFFNIPKYHFEFYPEQAGTLLTEEFLFFLFHLQGEQRVANTSVEFIMQQAFTVYKLLTDSTSLNLHDNFIAGS